MTCRFGTCQPRRGILICVLACCGLPAGSAKGQAACPRPALLRLTPLAGEWTVTWESRVNDTLTLVADSRASIRLTANGCAMIERLDGRLRGEPMALTTMITAPAPDSLQLAYVDSGHGRAATTRSVSAPESSPNVPCVPAPSSPRCASPPSRHAPPDP